ncbi:oligosaccharide flippase family protein [Colwellia sp. MB02u-18]|uniref:oligosaccharide flippase family protein n=1 Tax=unclassified Colwellia TaxID=196834 RepID=UPI0015F35E45|nr:MULTISPECIES: oligosaccharide flippase family protein [unclassified Colwellia]MBA6224526.1 oligosaccharide flippase family protein [Colwellia sp. MB3u-45]MBA6268162.1 oligosaccharide flippase family protein [Colwellia sp. MB3u-43]MBA6322614.1 oligosaccharide flippase family protein [Colwellia sp. MB02u-19]MBA6326192.1 oligosaccharide flippase family protein [Colwellia sp. MB02u-18]MBA6331651.1 oligosaccharide flippase family protein [Colwellia sp. MB02u-12]
MNININRNLVLKKNISWGLLFKILGMLLSYISIPIVLNYLGEKHYGVWITIFSVMSWVYTFDVGVGNGLKIRLTEAMSNNNLILAKEYISAAYILIIGATIFLLIIGGFGIYTVNLTHTLNIVFLEESYLQKVILVVFFFTLSNFVIGLYKQLLFAVHQSALIGLTNVLYQSIVISLIILADSYGNSSLLLVAFIYGFSNLLVGIIFTFIFFYSRKELRPHVKNFKVNNVKAIAGLGIEFFIIQLCVIIIFSTDNLIITNLLGPEAVTSYSIVAQLFQAFIVMWYLVSAPLTPLYTDAFIKNDIVWIKKTIKNLNYLFIIVTFIIILAIILGEWVTQFWLARSLEYPPYLFFFFGVFVLIRIYGDLYMSFLNAIGKLKWQLYLSIFGAVINIPLSIYCVNNLGMGSSGVILATCASLALLSVIMPIQAHIELNKRVSNENS